ncbi:ATP-binding protein [Salmonella enterica]|nr:ATP-binding protein [Salmonella enterica]
MANPNKYTERAELLAKRDAIDADLNYALTGEQPYTWRNYPARDPVIANCEKHGEYREYSFLIQILNHPERHMCSGCPECLRSELAIVERALQHHRVAELLANAGIGRRFERCELENYDAVTIEAGKNRDACQRYAEAWPDHLANGTSMAMIGRCGTGKNHLAVGLAKKIIRLHQSSVLITDVMQINRAVKSTWRANADRTEAEVLGDFISPDLLIIDELGAQTGNISELAILQELINIRYECVLPTIVISNLTLEQLRQGVGDRIVDRVTDGGNNRLIFDWPSYRGTGGAAA